MKKSNSIEALPELLSEFVFIGLLVVGVLLFFVWVTRVRPQRQVARQSAGSLPAAEPALASHVGAEDSGALSLTA